VYYGPITKQLLEVDTQIKWANIRKEPNGTVGNFYYKLKKKKEALKISFELKLTASFIL